MLYLITGVPGTGKTLRVVELVEKWLKEGREVYTNIGELNLVVQLPDGSHNQALTLDQCPQDAQHTDNQGRPFVDPEEPSPKRFDWRRAPAGSVIVIDEAQQWYPSLGRGGRSTSPEITAMEVHRHAGFDLVLITQQPGLLHSNVRALVTQHQHGRRAFGRHVARWSIRDRTMDVSSRRELDSGEVETWKYPTRFFGKYKSAVEHTHKGRIPRQLKIIGAVMAVLLCVILYRLPGMYQSFSQIGKERQVATAPARATPAVHRISHDTIPAGDDYDPAQPSTWGDEDWARRLQASTPIAGCIATAQRCRCYTASGAPIAMDTVECVRRIAHPLPFGLGPFKSSSAGGAGEAGGAADRTTDTPAPSV